MTPVGKGFACSWVAREKPFLISFLPLRMPCHLPICFLALCREIYRITWGKLVPADPPLPEHLLLQVEVVKVILGLHVGRAAVVAEGDVPAALFGLTRRPRK